MSDVKYTHPLGAKIRKFRKLKEGLGIWNHINSIYEDGNLLDEEYDDWKSRYPDFLKPDDLYGYTESPEAENEINELTSQLPPHNDFCCHSVVTNKNERPQTLVR